MILSISRHLLEVISSLSACKVGSVCVCDFSSCIVIVGGVTSDKKDIYSYVVELAIELASHCVLREQ